MKPALKTCALRAFAAALLAAGAFLLVATFLPLINPRLFEYATDERGRTIHVTPAERGAPAQPLVYYLVGAPVALGLLAAAWYLNMKAVGTCTPEIRTQH
jgi:hypothetical protein